MLSGSTEEPDNTNGSKSNHQHKEAFWRQVEMRNLTYTLSPHFPLFAALTDPQKGGKKGAHGLLNGSLKEAFIDGDDLFSAVRFN